MWAQIQTILRGNTKCIIIEEGEPRYVIVPFEEYQQLQKNREDSIIEENSHKNIVEEERVNKEIQATHVREGEEEDNSFSAPIRIEDLPF